MSPQRIQRKRDKGWRMPEGTVYVGRPSGWGNPFKAGEPYRFVDGNGSTLIGVASKQTVVRLFERYLPTRPDLYERIRTELGGKDLSCWCSISDPCHADVLLRIANEEVAK
jgi:hypothetical protein